MVRHYKALLGVVVAAILAAVPAVATNTTFPPAPPAQYGVAGGPGAVPGTVNYVEGQVSVAGQPITQATVRSVQLQPNEVLETGQGRAEVLLTPGVFVRVGDNSAVRIVSPELLNTRVELLHGQAIVEVDELLKGTNLWVMMNGSTTRLDKEGLYDFNANMSLVQVFDGKATVNQGDRQKEVGKSHEMVLTTWKVQHFDLKAQAAQNPLYAWSNVRSEYEAEASMQSARTVFVGGGPYWYGPDWYWNPYWDMWGFIPADGIWFSPFGWPFYSPYVAYYAPGFGFGFGYRGFGYPGFGHGFVGHGHISSNAFAARGGFASRGMAPGFGGRGFAGGMRAGGFGGMHSGGFGGGRR